MSLERAKHNIEKYYTVVGTLEHLPKFLQLLEHLLPQFFKGVHTMYQCKWLTAQACTQCTGVSGLLYMRAHNVSM